VIVKQLCMPRQAGIRFSPRRATRRHWLVTTIASALVLLGGGGAIPAAARQASSQHDGLPAVLAEGTDRLAAPEVAWRIVADVAELPGEASFEERALGFAFWSTDPLRLTDQTTGAERVIGQTEAAFVADGVTEKRESLGGQTASYLRLAVVPSEQRDDPGGDRLIFAGDPFPALDGERSLTLYETELRAGDPVVVVGSGAPTLVLVLQGSVTVATDAGLTDLTTVVGSGTSYAVGSFDGNVRFVANRGATFVAFATIGA